LAQKERKK